MRLFRPYKDNDEPEAAEPSDDAVGHKADGAPGKKGPTPTRKQAEQVRIEALRPKLTKKERRAREREVQAERNARLDAHLERQPERVLMRNFIDARWTFSEFTWPVMFLAFAGIILSMVVEEAALIVNYALWAILLAIVLETMFLWTRFKRELFARYPAANKRGLLSAMISRMVTMRRFRNPPTAINRGDDY